MKTFQSTDEILNFAMDNEQRAVDFYIQLAEEAKIDEMKEVFQQFAKEEMGHKARIQKIKDEGVFDMPVEKIQDMKISDYTAHVEVRPNMDYRDTLLVAMAREKSAFKLYSKLAQGAQNEDIRNLFLSLAQEEAKHKLRFELEYDEFVLREN